MLEEFNKTFEVEGPFKMIELEQRYFDISVDRMKGLKDGDKFLCF